MIGKDMTKMTLPVSFNEPTSLLQRVTEDMVGPSRSYNPEYPCTATKWAAGLYQDQSWGSYPLHHILCPQSLS